MAEHMHSLSFAFGPARERSLAHRKGIREGSSPTPDIDLALNEFVRIRVTVARLEFAGLRYGNSSASHFGPHGFQPNWSNSSDRSPRQTVFGSVKAAFLAPFRRAPALERVPADRISSL
jgi:hypothetical protein